MRMEERLAFMEGKELRQLMLTSLRVESNDKLSSDIL